MFGLVTSASDRGDSIEELSQALDLQIQGAEKPTVWRLVGIRFLLLPYAVAKVMSLGPAIYKISIGVVL